jgi:hypothetical protein
MTDIETPSDAGASEPGGESAPPAPPREVTAVARRRAWVDPRVRFWWLAAGVLLVIALYFAVTQTVIWSQEAWLIERGVQVEARVDHADGITVRDRLMPPASRVGLSFEWEGEVVEVSGHLAGREEHIRTGAEVPIRVHPENPRIWTYRTEPTPLWRALIGPIILLPVIAAAGLVSWWMQRRLVRIWREGEAFAAVVVESRQTAIAPLSKAVRLAPAEGADKRLISVFVPQRVANPQRGDVLWLIRSPKAPDRAIVARMYQER